MWSLLLLAAAVWSFANLPLGLSSRNKVVLQRWSLSGYRVDIRQDSEFATGNGYPKLLSNENRILNRISEMILSIFRGFRLLVKLHIAQSFIYYLQKHLFGLLCHDSQFVYGIISLCRNVIPSSLSAWICSWCGKRRLFQFEDVVCCVPGLRLASVGLLWPVV